MVLESTKLFMILVLSIKRLGNLMKNQKELYAAKCILNKNTVSICFLSFFNVL